LSEPAHIAGAAAAAATHSSLPCIVLEGSGGSRRIVLDHSPFTVGRRVDNDLCLAEPHVSRLQARIIRQHDDWYIEDRRMIPSPSKPKPGQHQVELPASYAAKILLLNEMSLQKVRPIELARRMKVTPQEVNRLLNVRHATKIDSIANALKALGKTLEIRAA